MNVNHAGAPKMLPEFRDLLYFISTTINFQMFGHEWTKWWLL